MSKNKKLKILLIIEGFILLIPVFTSVKINHIQSKINDIQQYIESRFLELLRAENSISDSRLEVIEMSIYAEKLQLGKDQKIEFDNALQNIKSRYNNKIDSYQPLLDEYSNILTIATTDTNRYSKIKTIYEFFGLLTVIIAFMINTWIIYKHTREN